jgi:hypothetical protein
MNQLLLKPSSILQCCSIIILLNSGCTWFEQSEHKQIIEDYEIGWNDLVQNRNISKPQKKHLGYYDVLVESYVFAVGYNDSFIIAKHCHFGDTATYYAIIDIKKNEKYGGKKGAYQFLNNEAFNGLLKRLNIKHISFSINYPKYP